MAVPCVVLSIGKMISVMTFSGMNAASSQIARFAVYPRKRCSLHGKAMIWLLLVSWIIVRVLRVMLLRSIGFVVKLVILSNIIMLCLSDGLMMSVVVFGCVKA